MKVWKRVRRGFNIFLICLVVLVAVLCGYILIERYALKNDMPTIFGYGFAVVVSGSMEPTIMTGDMIITKKCKEYVEDDIICFTDPSLGYVTHRIIGVNDDGTFTTKGDLETNSVDMHHVSTDEIVGKVVVISTTGGQVMSFLQKPVGIICVFGGVFILWLLIDCIFWIVKISLSGRKQAAEGREISDSHLGGNGNSDDVTLSSEDPPDGDKDH
ncbi:MAG: signal peptidase I [Bacteroidales bacterium]|nr:signal peptidase I [Bacteroidales bacterium]